ncbi:MULTISPECIES: signal peptidase I [unclassified Saccharopolyspora]|uniref:signal peptidase I n=1 Tax=Saccharopolyspora TaxID=1835 RepID=UPI0025E3B1AB|nr:MULTISPECIES: signal peptidase I [unclassified Saccharopolyspora]
MADVMRSTGPEEEPQEGPADNREGGGKGRFGRRSRRKRERKSSFWRELPILIVTALVLTVLIQTFLARVYVIPSQSMEQTLHGCDGCQNDRVLVDKVSYRFTDPEPGDVVVFRGPETWGNNEFNVPEASNPVAGFFQGALSLLGFGSPDEKDFVKRVIATGGQTVSCCDPQNRMLVDGKPLDEPYVYWEPGEGERHEAFAPVTVPQGRLWVQGDNRGNSQDSRYQGGGGVNGTVPVDNVIGKAQVIVLPPTRWQSIPEPNPQADALGAPAWQAGVPAGVGFAAAFPVLWAGRRVTAVVSDRRARRRH